ncbi:PAS domain S-box protein, partial [bacterium]|nr:PAS domain S-box protein [bacterium]
GKYVFVNDRFAEIHGYTREELLGMEFLTLIHPDERETLEKVASKRIDGEVVPERYEVRRLGRDGRTIWCEMMATRIEYGGRPAVMGNIIDISERKRALAAVQQRDETLSGIIASMTDPMSMIDNEHNIAWANSFARQLFGPDLVGKKCYSVYHGYDKPCTSCVVRKCFEDGEVHEHETEVIAADGRRMVFWCTASVAGWHRDGRPKLVVEISRDITERKRAEEALKKSVHQLQVAYDQSIVYADQLNQEMAERKQAEEALRERKEALKAQAHKLEEVNTALKVLLRRREEDKTDLEEKVLSNVKELVLPYVQTLRNTRLDAKQMAYVGIIESNLNSIVSPFLRKLSSKYLGLTPKEIQVAGLVKEGKTSKE